VDQIEVAVVGVGWCGGIRAEACAAHPLVSGVHVAENRPERLQEIAASIGAKSATGDYRVLLDNKAISAVDDPFSDDEGFSSRRKTRLSRKADRA
jgi:myo-inositol 2-dehydrogenase/D-chiro-inositol 1-dehydrogenase